MSKKEIVVAGTYAPSAANQYVEDWLDWAKDLAEEIITDLQDNKMQWNEGLAKLDNGWAAYNLARKAKQVTDWQQFSFPEQWEQHLVNKYAAQYGNNELSEQLARHMIGLAYHSYNSIAIIKKMVDKNKK